MFFHLVRNPSGLKFRKIEQYLGLAQDLPMFECYDIKKQVRTLSLLLAAEHLYAIKALSKEETTVSNTCQITLLHLVTSGVRVPLPMFLDDLENILFCSSLRDSVLLKSSISATAPSTTSFASQSAGTTALVASYPASQGHCSGSLDSSRVRHFSTFLISSHVPLFWCVFLVD